MSMAEKIQTIIPRYGELNKVYSDLVSGKDFNFSHQRFISDFYEGCKDVQDLEASIIQTVLQFDLEHCTLLLNSLRVEIERNISLYENNRSLFGALNIGNVCKSYASEQDWSIKLRTSATQECYKELMRVNGSLDAIGFREHTQREEDELEKEYERCRKEYEAEQKKLQDLYDVRKQLTEEAASHSRNCFKDIHTLGTRLLSILEKYTTVSQKETKVQENDRSGEEFDTVNAVYFSMKLVSAIYELCDSRQFEHISEKDFYANLNLHPCENKLKIKPREKARVCYLIFLMGETLSLQDRESWKKSAMKMLDIDAAYYKSKYKEPVSDFPSDSNQAFAEELRSIFR